MRVLSNLRMKAFGRNYKISVHVEHYANSRFAITLTTPMDEMPAIDEPFGTLTVNLPDEWCPPNEVFIKNYSENEGFLEWAAANEIIVAEPLAYVRSGFVVITRHALTPKFLALIQRKEQKQ